ncbi:hypothetical protein VNO77_41347 [Canavalia gladiata]|uniref:NAB domain-containing protein n=1 Tax=Canavalia gladiata TaxID=3824 RepID=A0AAN9PSH3_CANGL
MNLRIPRITDPLHFADMETNLTRMVKLIKNEEQSKKEGEVVAVIEDFYNQYQSLYSLYGRLTGEYVVASPRRAERGPSVSSSSSESEYFSSEEVDGIGNIDINDSNQKHFFRERERSTFAYNTNEALLKTQPLNEFEEQLITQAKELKSLNKHKKNLELQVESQACEVKQLGADNTELQARVLELELLLKESKETVSVLQSKLKNNEDQTSSKIAEFMTRINKLEQEAKSLRTQKGKMEEKIKRNRNEALNQKKDLTDQLSVVQQKLDCVNKLNKELESKLEKEREKVSQGLVQIENLNEKFAETTMVEKNMVKEKERFLARIKDLELEVESRCSNQDDLEKNMRETRCEIKRVEDERKATQDRNHELERALAQRGEEISALSREHENSKNEASIQATTLRAQIDNLRLELESLKNQKNELKLNNELEYSECIAKIENLNGMLVDREETIKKLKESIKQINAENIQARLKVYQQLTEKKMQELAEEFRKTLEDNIRLLRRRLLVAEQLNNENKDTYKTAKEMYEQQIKMLQEKNASYEDELRKLKVKDIASSDIEVHLNRLELAALNGIDLVSGKLEEHREYTLGLVSKMLEEVQFAKDWIREKKGEIKVYKEKVDSLTLLVGEKEEENFLLRQKVWKLEANVSKEGGEKLNLMKAVKQLERKVRKLEKNLREKDEELVGLGEKKCEAIRQLCLLVEFHRDRCKDLMSKKEKEC